MRQHKTFHGAVSDGRYEQVRFFYDETEITEVELSRFGLSDSDSGRLYASFGDGFVMFVVPHIHTEDGIADKRLGQYIQPWDVGGCSLLPAPFYRDANTP